MAHPKLPAAIKFLQHLVKLVGKGLNAHVSSDVVQMVLNDFESGGSNQTIYLAKECIYRLAGPSVVQLGYTDRGLSLQDRTADDRNLLRDCMEVFSVLEDQLSHQELQLLEQGRAAKTPLLRSAFILDSCGRALMMALDEKRYGGALNERRSLAETSGLHCAEAAFISLIDNPDDVWMHIEAILRNLPAETPDIDLADASIRGDRKGLRVVLD